MKATNREKELCVEIAKYYRKPIRHLSLYFYRDDSEGLCGDIEVHISFNQENQVVPEAQTRRGIIPFWLKDDCESFLRKRGWRGLRSDSWSDQEDQSIKVEAYGHLGKKCVGNPEKAKAETTREAVLQVVLKILKEE